MDSADTTINVNGGAGPVPPRPEFTARQRSTHTTPNAPAGNSSVTVETHNQINWGSIVKGAAIVAGVVLVGVAAYYVVPAALTSLGIIGPGGMLTGIVEAATPAVTAVSNQFMLGLNFVDDFVATLAGNIASGLGLGGVFSSATGAVSTASAATTAAVSHVTGAIAAGGTLAAGIPLAVKSIAMMPFSDTVHVATQHTSTVTGLEDGGATIAQTKKAGIAGQQASIADLPDLPDDHLIQDQAATMKAASKVAHHAAHAAEGSAHEGGHDMDVEPDAPEQRTRTALRNSEHASKAWAERVGSREKHTVAPRSSEFASQIAEDRAKLDAALAERA